MATGGRYPSTKERVNYGRLCRAIVDLCTDAMRKILTNLVVPSQLLIVVQYCSDLRKLAADDLHRINNAVAGASYGKFDIAFLYKLIRAISTQGLRYELDKSIPAKSICTKMQSVPSLMTQLTSKQYRVVQNATDYSDFDCGLLTRIIINLTSINIPNIIPSANDWGGKCPPKPTDVKLGDDIVRIRLISNNVYGHISNTCVTDSTFQKYWTELTGIMQRMDQEFNTGGQYLKDLNDTASLDDKWEIYELTIRELAKREQERHLPMEIRLLDKKAAQLFETALKFGKEKVYHIRLMVIGPYGAGKTCLINRLLKLGMKMDEIQSTVGIDVHRNTCGLNVPEREWILSKNIKENFTNFGLRKWKVLKSYGNREENLTGEENSMRPEDGFETTDSPPNYDNQAQISDKLGSNAEKEKMEPMLKRRGFERSDEESDPDSSLKVELKGIFKNGKYKDTEEIIGEISVWDFAGQFEFYSTHQTFLTARAIYLLIVDMSMKIENKTKDTGGKRRPIEEMAENAEFWLQSIHTHSEQIGDDIHEKDHLLPHVILVGTHLDKFKEDKQQNAGDDIKSERDTFFTQLRRHLAKKVPVSVKHLCEEDFAVDNTKEDDESVVDLRNTIYELASNQKYWGEEIPIRWISLEEKLANMRKDKIVSFDVIRKEAKNLKHKVENEDELNLFLTFQHNLGNIIYFSDLKEFIVLEVQWMINAFKSFITSDGSNVEGYLVRKFNGKVSLWDTFSKYGILEDELIDALWKEKEDFIQHKDHLLRVMEKHDILTKPLVYNENGKQETSNFYLLPCMVKDKINEEKISEIFSQAKSSPYLYFKFENEFLNPSIFHKLLTTCMKNYKLSCQGKEKKLLLFYNCGIFDMDNSRTVRFFIGLSDYVLKLKVYRFGREPECSKCMEVKIFIEDRLKSLFGIYQQQNFPPTLHIKCKKSADSFDDMDGLIPVENLGEHAEFYCDTHSGEGHLVKSIELLRFWIEPEHYEHLVQRKDESDICDEELKRKKGKIHADLIMDLRGKLPTSEQNYKDFLMRLEWQALIPRADVLRATDDIYIAFELMYSKGCMKPGDYGTLKKLLGNEKSLVETIEKYEKKFQCL